jgi:hypothetical protein
VLGMSLHTLWEFQLRMTRNGGPTSLKKFMPMIGQKVDRTSNIITLRFRRSVYWDALMCL